MKARKILLVVCMAFAAIFAAKADNDKMIAAEQLPSASREFLQKYFKDTGISYVKVEQDFMERSYEVLLMNGSKVEFDRSGQWETVDCRKDPLPDGIVPAQIDNFVKKNHPGQSIVKIDRDKRGYEIELRNGLEIKFDKKYNMVSYDD